uniref:AraC family transcriptional regulator n=1 Tax=Gordonia sp. B7-2 TaxID=3420932 RepID=UPI003D8C48C8
MDPTVLDRWQRDNGREGELGEHRSRRVRSRGRNGIEQYADLVELDAADPDDFEQLVYWRPLSKLFAFCLLQTPVRTRRTTSRIRDYPSDFFICAVQTLGSTTGTANGCEFAARAGQITVTDSRLPYDLTTHGTSDAIGLWVPTELLGSDIAAGATTEPLTPDTVLTRACASLVVRLARDAVIGGADVDLDTEFAAIEVIRAMIEQTKSADDVAPSNPLFVRAAVSDLIERNFRDPAFNAASVAALLHMSRRQLYRSLQGEDFSLAELIVTRRLEWARSLLTQPGQVRLEGIAHAAGFRSVATLRNRFRARYGMTPDEYRHALPDVGRGTAGT